MFYMVPTGNPAEIYREERDLMESMFLNRDGKPVYGKDGVPSDYLLTPRASKTMKALHTLKREHPGKVSFSKEVTDAYVKNKKRQGQVGGALLGGALGTGAGAVLGSRLIPNKGIRMATGGVLGAGLGGYAGGRHQGGKARKDVDKVTKAHDTHIARLLYTLAHNNRASITLRNEDGSNRMVIRPTITIPRQEKKAMFYEVLMEKKAYKRELAGAGLMAAGLGLNAIRPSKKDITAKRLRIREEQHKHRKASPTYQSLMKLRDLGTDRLPADFHGDTHFEYKQGLKPAELRRAEALEDRLYKEERPFEDRLTANEKRRGGPMRGIVPAGMFLGGAGLLASSLFKKKGK